MTRETVIPNDSIQILEGFPRGLCEGVKRALVGYDQMVKDANGDTVYSIGEPAHNTHIINRYAEQGVVFVNSVEEVPDGARAVFGPHGSTEDDIQKAKEKGLTFIDTQCPLVTKVKKEIERIVEKGNTVLYFGQEGHAETRAAMSVAPQHTVLVLGIEHALSDGVASQIPDRNKVALNTQTTHNFDEVMEMAGKLRTRYPNLLTPSIEDACYATRNRQTAVKKLIEKGAETIVVVGSPTSSNSRKLKEVALENGAKQVFFVDSASELKGVELTSRIGLTAGASVEEGVIEEVRNVLTPGEIEKVVVADESGINFAPPKIQRPV